MDDKFYYVYVLYQEQKPVYVGCTANLKQRLYTHLDTKSFDSYRILFNCGIKQHALDYERALISFMVIHYPDLTYNKQKRNFVMLPDLYPAPQKKKMKGVTND